MKFFLTIKHWQLFAIIFAIPLILQFVIMGALLINSSDTLLFTIFPILMGCEMIIFFCWFYSLGINLHKKLPETIKMSLIKFKIFLFIPAIYMVFFTLFFVSLFDKGVLNPAIFIVIFPCHFLSMFGVFYDLYFISKSLKTVELQRPVKFEDFAGEFFLFLIFPIGIWFLQPRVNKIFKVQDTKD